MEYEQKPLGPHIGGTIIATVVALVVITVVSTIVTFLMALFQYYIGNVREEAALFIGNVAGGITSVYAARGACDSTIKQYSLRTIFSILAVILCGLSLFQLSLEWHAETIYRLSFLISNLITAYIVFWKGDY